MRIRFLSDQIYETEGHGRGPRFAAGDVVDASEVGGILGRNLTGEAADDFLRRWSRRGVAEVVDARTPTSAQKRAAEVEAAEVARAAAETERKAAEEAEAKRKAGGEAEKTAPEAVAQKDAPKPDKSAAESRTSGKPV